MVQLKINIPDDQYHAYPQRMDKGVYFPAFSFKQPNGALFPKQTTINI